MGHADRASGIQLTPEFAKASKVLAANRGSITAFSPLACFGASISAKPAGK
jgi:hypothetical protein